MNENTAPSTMPEENAAPQEDAAAITEIGDSGMILLPDEPVEEVDAEEDERKVFERIQARPEGGAKYDPSEQTALQKISNFWYRNKMLVILGAVALLMVGYLTVISLPESYDCEATLYVSDSDYPVSITYELQEELKNYAGDADGDGECKVLVNDFYLASGTGMEIMANYMLMQEHLQNKPMNMLWIVDRELFDMMVEAYGEEIFEPFDGAPLWIEITCNEVLSGSVARGESPRLGLCLRRLTDELARDRDLAASYENSRRILGELRGQHPEMFEAGENAAQQEQ